MSFDKMFTAYGQIPQITPTNLTGAPGMNTANGATDGVEFGEVLSDAIRSVDASQFRADDKLRSLASGKDVDIHGTMIAMEEADITLRTMTSVRDKVVEAYQKLMNMSI
jgi:flagellar hook-basal body complex protein FliE